MRRCSISERQVTLVITFQGTSSTSTFIERQAADTRPSPQAAIGWAIANDLVRAGRGGTLPINFESAAIHPTAARIARESLARR